MPAAGGPASDVGRVAGWYGKLPTVGDFASRRLEADFIDPWDHWLGDGLQAQRDALGDAWLDAFLHSPAWRFVLAPGTLAGFDPAATIAGVVMPSVDRVGRYFPLTLAGSIGRMPATASEFEAVLAWIDRLENTALDALQSDWGIDDLEAALAAMAPPSQALASAPRDPLARAREALARALAMGGGIVDVAPVAQRSELATVLAAGSGGDRSPHDAAAWSTGPALAGVALWLADGAPSPQLLVSTGLPERDAFLHMFGRPRAAGDTEAPAATAAPASAEPRVAAAGGIGEDTVPLRGPAPTPPSAHDADLLALFEADLDAPVTDPLAGAPPRDDILALFDATGDEPPLVPPPAAGAAVGDDHEATRIDGAVAHDDLIALFDKADAAPAPHDAGAAQTNADDILGLFGDAPPRRDPPGR